jgi:putative nucleotidyltransferase with HDIG domain
MSDFSKINKELIIILLLTAIAGLIFFFVSNQRAFLNFFYIPVILGAFYYGKRYATLSALLAFFLIGIIAAVYPKAFYFYETSNIFRWLDIVTWGAFLLITGYLMGLLYESKEEKSREIGRTYRGIIEMLSVVIDTADKHTQSHSFRVSLIAEMIARKMRCPDGEIENIKIAALLHDIGKLGISSETLQKIGKLSNEEKLHIKTHPKLGTDIIGAAGSSRVLEILPLILHHHEQYSGSGYNELMGENIPLGARIIAVADVFEALTADRPYRKALSFFDAKKEIVDNSGTQFDPVVVEAFEAIFSKLYRDGPIFPSVEIG